MYMVDAPNYWVVNGLSIPITSFNTLLIYQFFYFFCKILDSYTVCENYRIIRQKQTSAFQCIPKGVTFRFLV